MITAEDMQELAQKRNEAFDKYVEGLKEFTLERLGLAVDAAEIGVRIQANADTRTPFIVIEISDKDLFGRTEPAQISISAYEMLQCPSLALSKAAGSIPLLHRGISASEAFSPAAVDRIEEAAVQAVLHDLRLRLKKNSLKPWLQKLKEAVDKALIEGVQKS